MINENILDRIQTDFPQMQILLDEPMKNHTTFRVGGNADAYISIHSIQELQGIMPLIKQYEIPYYVIGNGSNLLVSDMGYHGVIIEIATGMNEIRMENHLLHVQAGAYLSSVAKYAMNAGLTGLEFAAGIPGTMGGAIVMNAGAYDGEMKQVVREVTLLDTDGKILVLSAEEMAFGYRDSIVKHHPYIVLEVALQLSDGQTEDIAAKMQELNARRKEKQPLEYPSAGSTFKRPQGYFAGKLIMDAGLRGFCHGDAQVSEKHCGFVINRGNATASDIYQLMQIVIQRVQESFGVLLEPEVITLGEFK